ncbi:MerR family transcriptional regulator [Streptosporangium lutulentum]|uniref:DNA-binding transcriptional MerR regulator n=1 Tax=Streptosporangium lutulentum TaxID=1461250 RepID=A0ABT9QEK7_9ACTN|nr:MerR family transcriptional regulator [Streptosporangium lutulentum]MDP9845205.1 DNA-binding transcriptional MerR regulator [Streptosporangium lutulentum]
MEWTIGELVERASAALASGARLNGRVRDVPNERLIRWYSTIGLLDPPSARRGRVALYGRRHLLQLIAVKRRQADGRTIAEIQAELAGAADQVLETIARLPETPAETVAETVATRTPRPRFWAEPPSAPAAPPSAPAGPPPAGTAPLPVPPPVPAAPAAASAPSPAAASPLSAVAGSAPATSTTEEPRPSALPAIVHGVRLATGVTLLLDGGGRTPSPDDLAEIAATSGALLAVLRERGLISPEGRQS